MRGEMETEEAGEAGGRECALRSGVGRRQLRNLNFAVCCGAWRRFWRPSSASSAFAGEGIGCLGPLALGNGAGAAETAKHPRRPTTDEFINDQGCILSHSVLIRKWYDA